MDSTPAPPPVRNITPGKAFASVFLAVFLLIFVSSALITFILPESYTSVARVRAATVEQLEIFQSSAVLTAVVDRLELNQSFGRRYGESGPLAADRTMELFRRMVVVRRIRGTDLAEIRVNDLDRDEAAHLANAIARTGATNGVFVAPPGTGKAEIIDLALPPLRPSRPNKPLNLILGALVGTFLGVMSGGVAARLAVGFGRDSRIQLVEP
jgi:uncharacterized protein involved in exopolysaccharide biosynthesis